MGFDFDNQERSESMKKRMIHLGIWVGEIVAVIALAFLIVHSGLQKIEMYGDSMSPTLIENDSIIVNKMIYRFQSPKRGDVIVFKQSGQEHSYFNVKRIIGLPGETIQIKDGSIYIDGTLYEESIDVETIENSGLASSEYTLEEDEYFVLGDNRNQSVDSRFASFGTVVRDDIIGKAWIRVNGFNFISNLNIKEVTEETSSPSATAEATATTEPTATAAQ